MNGRIEEISYDELTERYISDQSALDEFDSSPKTYIAVVRGPIGDIRVFCDEVWEELGMPEGCESDDVYKEYVREDSVARQKVNEIVERVRSGEQIVLVCYENGGDSCHRYLLVDIIKELVKRRQNCKFTLSA